MKTIRMVDVGNKPETLRQASAKVELYAKPKVIRALRDGTFPKGDAIATAQIAGIQAAKKTAEWIPLCHPLRLTHVDVDCHWDRSKVIIVTKVTAKESTGVEMEALTAAVAAALAIYDMAKSMDDGMKITNLHLLNKSGGQSGSWSWRGRR
jgi:cyclic pyranopterin phosphate synthase